MSRFIDDYYGKGFALAEYVLPRDFVDECLAAYRSMPPRTPQWNKVTVDGPFPAPLDELYTRPELVDLMTSLKGPDIALYNYRLVVKDKHSRDAVFVHQDCGYHVGFMRKASLFVALTDVCDENGGLVLYPGTHKYGYLGDAGEIDHALIAEQPCAHVEMAPGDCLVMNSNLWHGSHPHMNGPDRVMADIIFQCADDPSGTEIIEGEWRCTPKPFLRRAKLLERSRASRLKELQDENERLLQAVKGVA